VLQAFTSRLSIRLRRELARRMREDFLDSLSTQSPRDQISRRAQILLRALSVRILFTLSWARGDFTRIRYLHGLPVSPQNRTSTDLRILRRNTPLEPSPDSSYGNRAFNSSLAPELHLHRARLRKSVHAKRKLGRARSSRPRQSQELHLRDNRGDYERQ